MGYKMGMPNLKLNNVGKKSKHCGSFEYVAKEALKERCGRDKDIDPERTYLNMYGGYETAEELMAYSKQHVESLSAELRAQGKRGIRNDAVVMASIIFKPPMEYWDKMTLEESERLFPECLNKFGEIVGAENIKAWAIHYDELNPHMHVFWEPMTEDGRLCAKEVCNLKFFSRLNREMPIYLREQGFDIADCEAYDAGLDKSEFLGEKSYASRKSKRQHGVDSRTYKYQQEKKVKELVAQIEDKKQILDSIDENIKQIENSANEHANDIITEAKRIADGIEKTANIEAEGIVEKANITSDNIVKGAKLEAEMIINNAKKNSEHIIIEASMKAENIVSAANKKSEELAAKNEQMQEDYDEIYARYVDTRQKEEFMNEQLKRINKEYEEYKKKLSKSSELDKQIKIKENYLVELAKASVCIIWKVFEIFFNGIANVVHFAKDGELGLAKFALNNQKEEALKMGDKLAPELKTEMDMAIKLITDSLEERYIREYKR